MCTGSGGCGELIALAVLAAIAVLVVVVGASAWVLRRTKKNRAARTGATEAHAHRDTTGGHR